MTLFSERYGYTTPSEILIREDLPIPVQSSLINWISMMKEYIDFKFINKNVSQFYFNRVIERNYPYEHLLEIYIRDDNFEWYRKLDMIEFMLPLLKEYHISRLNNEDLFKEGIKWINSEFDRLNYAYRIIDDKIVEVTHAEEITSISNAIQESQNSIKIHLQTALKLLSAAQKHPDYRNSIKESISAVEAYCRTQTGEGTLGKALKRLEQNGLIIPKILKDTFEKLYAYTNDPATGVRHALMDDSGQYTPSSDEASFILVACSSFINYLQKKKVTCN